MIALDSTAPSPKHPHGTRVCGSGAQWRWRSGSSSTRRSSSTRQWRHGGSGVGSEGHRVHRTCG